MVSLRNTATLYTHRHRDLVCIPLVSFDIPLEYWKHCITGEALCCRLQPRGTATPQLSCVCKSLFPTSVKALDL